MARKEENASQPRPHRVRRVIAAILKVLGTLLLVALLTTLVLACLFALYVKTTCRLRWTFPLRISRWIRRL